MLNINELLKKFELYINTDSNTYCKEDVDNFSRIIEAESRNAGFIVKRHKQQTVGDFLEITVGTGKNNILLLGHMDTVFPKGTAAARPFKYDEQRAYGPGVLDMKGGLFVIMQAMKSLAPDIPTDYSITALFNSEEEIGSVYSNELIKEKASNAIAALSFEGTSPGCLITERNGIISFDIELTGIPAHAGVSPHLGRSAIEEAASKILRLYELRDDSKNIIVNIGKISGGSAKNIIAENTLIIGEIRYINPEDRSEILNKLKEIVKTTSVSDVKSVIELRSDRPPMTSNPGSKRLFNEIQSLAENMGHKLVARKSGGGGDAAFAGVTGIPVIDGLGLEGEGAHTDKEYALIDSIPFKIELTTKIVSSIMNADIDIAIDSKA